MIALAATSRIEPAQLRNCVDRLPALPRAAAEALAALRDESASLDRCAESLGRDQSLVGRTLRLANSAFYGLPGRVGSVRDAVYMLGRRTLSSMVMAATLRGQFEDVRCSGFDFQAFWRHSAAVALAARGVAREIGHDAEQAFAAGLLHDIGLLALATHFPRELGLALATARERDESLDSIEQSLLACGHAEIGAGVAQHWRLPAALCEAVRGHHHPAAARSDAAPTLADVVHVADAIAHGLDLASVDDEAVPHTELAAWSRVALGAPQCLRVFRETEDGVAGLCQALELK